MCESPGLSGGAVGSSQSPSWKPAFQSPVCPVRPSTRSTHARMLSYWSARICVSPSSRYIVHGTITAASPQAAVGKFGNPHSTHGTKLGTCPWSRCSWARSRSQPVSVPCAANSRRAVGAKTWMSPVQPTRSSRWGQSVGRSTKLSRMLHTTFECSWFRPACELSNVPVRRIPVWITTASTSPSRSSPGQFSSSAYWKPWIVNRGEYSSPAVPAATYVSTEVAVRRGRMPSSPFSITSAWCSTIVCPRSARGRIRRTPEMFWPKSSRMRPFGRRSTDTGRSTSVSWTGSAVGASIAAVNDSRGNGIAGAQPEASKPGADQPSGSRRASKVSPS